MKILFSICTVAVLLAPAGLFAFDAATHWYLGLNTTDVSSDYDPTLCVSFLYQNTFADFCVLKLQHFQLFYMKYFGDAHYFSQQFSSVDVRDNLCYDN